MFIEEMRRKYPKAMAEYAAFCNLVPNGTLAQLSTAMPSVWIGPMICFISDFWGKRNSPEKIHGLAFGFQIGAPNALEAEASRHLKLIDFRLNCDAIPKPVQKSVF
jgi:hypothetical protein